MWVMTSYGIFMPGLRPSHTVPEGDNRLLQIRARRIQDLEILRKEHLPGLGDIIRIEHTDYQYRAYCTHEQWAAALAKIAMDIDYVKFKDTTEKKYHDRALHNLYNILWGKILDAFPTGSVYTSYKSNRGHAGWTSTYATPRWAGPMKASDSMWNTVTGDSMTAAEIDEALKEYDLNDEVPPPRRPSGQLDHSLCEHGNSKNAKRRCARKWK
jgi:hypothetical protein